MNHLCKEHQVNNSWNEARLSLWLSWFCSLGEWEEKNILFLICYSFPVKIMHINGFSYAKQQAYSTTHTPELWVWHLSIKAKFYRDLQMAARGGPKRVKFLSQPGCIHWGGEWTKVKDEIRLWIRGSGSQHHMTPPETKCHLFWCLNSLLTPAHGWFLGLNTNAVKRRIQKKSWTFFSCSSKAWAQQNMLRISRLKHMLNQQRLLGTRTCLSFPTSHRLKRAIRRLPIRALWDGSCKCSPGPSLLLHLLPGHAPSASLQLVVLLPLKTVQTFLPWDFCTCCSPLATPLTFFKRLLLILQGSALVFSLQRGRLWIMCPALSFSRAAPCAFPSWLISIFILFNFFFMYVISFPLIRQRSWLFYLPV